MEAPDFWARVDQSSGPTACWPWLGSRTTGGYGQVYMDKRVIKASRAAWVLARGPVRDGLHVLHYCDNPPCCNPNHLWLGTPADNAQDSVAKGRHYQQKKRHCPAGHPYAGTNLRIETNGYRRCRTCHARHEQKRRRR